jgi:hypothetical protein
MQRREKDEKGGDRVRGGKPSFKITRSIRKEVAQ